MPTSAQQTLSFGPIHNVGLFSSHWLDQRLELEPEWRELRDEAGNTLERLAELWKVQRNRVERYGDEQGLEEGFIQPVLRTLRWQLKYQTFVQGREPDYALFLDDAALDATLAARRTSPDSSGPPRLCWPRGLFDGIIALSGPNSLPQHGEGGRYAEQKFACHFALLGGYGPRFRAGSSWNSYHSCRGNRPSLLFYHAEESTAS